MRTLIIAAIAIFGINAKAQVLSCDDTLKLTCTAGFHHKDTRTTDYQTQTAKYEVMNADDLAESYCEASIKFTNGDLYLHGSLAHDRSITVGVVKSDKNGKTMDIYGTRADLGLNKSMNMYFSVSPFEAAPEVHSVSLDCKLTRD